MPSPTLSEFRVRFPEFTTAAITDAEMTPLLDEAYELHSRSPRATLYLAAHLASLYKAEHPSGEVAPVDGGGGAFRSENVGGRNYSYQLMTEGPNGVLPAHSLRALVSDAGKAGYGLDGVQRMISPTQETIEYAVRGYVAAGSGIAPGDVIPGQAPGPTPDDGLFATVLLIIPRRRGQKFVRQDLVGGQIKHYTSGAVVDRYSIQWYRKGAENAARSFALWVDTPEGLDYTFTNGYANFVLRRLGDMRTLNEVVFEQWEKRVSLDLEIGYIHTIQQDLVPVEKVPITLGGMGSGISFEVDKNSS